MKLEVIRTILQNLMSKSMETTEHHSSEESAKEYEVKECTTEVSVKTSDVSNIKECEEKLTSDFEGVLNEKSLKSHKTRGNHKLRDTVKHGSRPVVGNLQSRCTGNVQIKPTVPQPFSLATEKCASVGTRPAFEEDNKGSDRRKSLNKRNVLYPNMLKQNQLSSSLVSRKPLQPDNKKHPDEDDSCSVTSITAVSVRPIETRAIVASALVFRTTERAEKRKKFYSKLKEKHQAMKTEKSQSEAGYQDVIDCVESFAKLLKVKSAEVLVESTGVIGQRIKKGPLLNSLPILVNSLSSSVEGGRFCSSGNHHNRSC